jgi:replicative DNA helicase
VFLSNILYNVRSHPTLHLSLELTAAEVYEHLYRIHHFWKPDASREEMMEDFANIRIVDQNRLSRGDLATFVYEFAEETGAAPEVLILDYLGYFARGFRGSSSYERTSDAVMEVKSIAKEFNLGVIAPHQVNRGAEDGKPLDSDDSRDSGVIEETADFQLGLYRPGLMKKQDGSIEEDLC